MTFTEPPDPKLSIVHVLDVNGTDVESGPVQAVPGRDTSSGPAPSGPPRRRLHRELARRLRGGRPLRRRARSASVSTWRPARSSRRASRFRRRPRRPLPAWRASSASTSGSRCSSRPRSSGSSRSGTRARAATGPADRIGGGRYRRRRDAPVGAGRARRFDGRPAVIFDGHGLPLAARRRDVRRRRLDRCGADGQIGPRSSSCGVAASLAMLIRASGGPRLRRPDPGARDRIAVAPLHGRERVDGRPAARVPGGSRQPARPSGRRGPALFVAGRLRGGRRPGHRSAPRHGGGRRPLETPAPVHHLVPHHARHQGRAWSCC